MTQRQGGGGGRDEVWDPPAQRLSYTNRSRFRRSKMRKLSATRTKKRNDASLGCPAQKEFGTLNFQPWLSQTIACFKDESKISRINETHHT